MHGAGLVPTVGNVVEEVAHAGVLCALLSRAEVVVHHLVYDVVRDATTTVWNPEKEKKNILSFEEQIVDHCHVFFF